MFEVCFDFEGENKPNNNKKSLGSLFSLVEREIYKDMIGHAQQIYSRWEERKERGEKRRERERERERVPLPPFDFKGTVQ